MIKKRQPLIGIICFVLVLILFFWFYSYQTASQYKDTTPPKIAADSLKSLVTSLIQNEEFFVGDVSVKYVDIAQSSDLNKAEIMIRNNATGDDSIGATEYKILAEKKGQSWNIVEYKTHWKCARDIFLKFWTTKACI